MLQPLLGFLGEIYLVLKLGYAFLVLSLCSVCHWQELEQRGISKWELCDLKVALGSHRLACQGLVLLVMETKFPWRMQGTH